MTFRILYICTHNRCRSILCEAITNHLGAGLIEARSAGSQPEGAVHPLSLYYLAENGISTAGLTSKSWEDLGDWQPDLVLTVCDSAAGETCPLWLGSTLKLHWGLADPSRISGDSKTQAAFRSTMATIRTRVEALLDLRLHEKTAVERELLLRELIP